MVSSTVSVCFIFFLSGSPAEMPLVPRLCLSLSGKETKLAKFSGERFTAVVEGTASCVLEISANSASIAIGL